MLKLQAFHLQILLTYHRLVTKNSKQWVGAPDLLVTLLVIGLVPSLLWALVSTSVQYGGDMGPLLLLPQSWYRWVHVGQLQKKTPERPCWGTCTFCMVRG